MNMPFSGTAIVVSEEERQELQQMAQSRSLAAGDVMRVRMMLLLSEGVLYRKIQEMLDTTAPTISRWKERFRAHGVAGLVEASGPEAVRYEHPSCKLGYWPRSRMVLTTIPPIGRAVSWRVASASART